MSVIDPVTDTAVKERRIQQNFLCQYFSWTGLTLGHDEVTALLSLLIRARNLFSYIPRGLEVPSDQVKRKPFLTTAWARIRAHRIVSCNF